MISPADVLIICGVSGGVAAVGAVVGRLLLGSWTQQRSIRTTLAVVVGMPVVVMTIGVGLAADLMVVSGHALAVLLVVILIGALASGAVGALLARRVEHGSDVLGDAVRRLGSSSAPDAAEAPATRELAALWAQLEETHRELAVARDRERAAEAGRRELVAWVSHDLRAPLAAIQAMVEALEDDIVSDEETVREFHRRIREQVDRLSRMVAELFELSRITSGAMELDRQPVDLAVLITEAVAANGSFALSRGVALVSSAGPQAVADGDPRHLPRVLANLIINAVQHTPRGGTVELSAKVEAEAVVISVQDGCGGIPPLDLPRLFDTGYRGHAARTPDQDSGAGLGLAIVRGLVEAQAGTIAVSNATDGCRFDIRLPGSRPVGRGSVGVGSCPVHRADVQEENGETAHAREAAATRDHPGDV
jgi:signal transduction histidine kinase